LAEDGLLLKRTNSWESVDEIVTGPDGTSLLMRFYAYGPFRAEGLSYDCEGGAPVLHYETPADVDSQVDLIAGLSGEIAADATSAGLAFNHVLSAVTFSVDAGCTPATINAIRLKNVYASADYDWTSGWSGHDAEASFEIPVAAAVQTGTVSDLTSGGNTLMLIPQTFPEDASIVLSMEVDGEAVEIETSIAGVSVAPGKAYVFRMNFDVSTYDSIFTYHILMSHEVNIYKSSGENLWLPEMTFVSGTKKITVDWGDGSSQTVTSGTAVFAHSFPTDYEGDVIVKVKGTSPKITISGAHIQRIEKINIEGNERYDSDGGCNCIIETATNTLVYAGIDYSIPERVKTLGPYSMVTVEDRILEVPEGIETIRTNAIAGPNAYMKRVVLPASLTLLEDGAFMRNSLYGAAVAPGNPIYDSRDDDRCIMVTATDYMILGTIYMNVPEETKGIRPFACIATPSNITLPEGCLDLMTHSFGNNYCLKKIVFPKSCHIGQSAFSGCLYAEFDFSAGEICAESRAFYSCPKITTLDLSMFSSIGSHCFYSCEGLLSLEIPEGTEIPEYAFYSCKGLTTLIIPSSCEIGPGAFSYCTGLTSVELHSSLLRANVFKSCSALATVSLYDGFSSFSSSAFYLAGVTCIYNYCHEQPATVNCSVYKTGGVMHVLEGQDYTIWMAACGFTAKNWTWTDDLKEP